MKGQAEMAEKLEAVELENQRKDKEIIALRRELAMLKNKNRVVVDKK